MYFFVLNMLIVDQMGLKKPEKWDKLKKIVIRDQKYKICKKRYFGKMLNSDEFRKRAEFSHWKYENDLFLFQCCEKKDVKNRAYFEALCKNLLIIFFVRKLLKK